MKSVISNNTQKSSELNHRKVKIFLGEDDLDDQDFFKVAFETIGVAYEIICFTNGRQMLDELESMPDGALPSLIVLDYNLPILSGAEILKLLSQNGRYKNIPKIIWSTSNSPSFKSRCLENGAADYIVKPSDVEGLKRTGLQMQVYINK